MKKNILPEALVTQYIETIKVMDEAMQKNDYRRNNHAAKTLYRIEREFLTNDLELAKYVFGEVMKSENDRARGIAATNALRQNILVKQAVAVLEIVAKRSDLIGFGAERALKTWRGDYPGITL